MATRTLTDLEKRILAFESRWVGNPLNSGMKAAAARVDFGWSLTAYEMRLQELFKLPAALEAEPMLVKRAIAIREQNASERAARTLHRAG